MNGVDITSGKIFDKLDKISDGVNAVDVRLAMIETWQKAHSDEHKTINIRLDSHADDLRSNRSIIDTWKGYAFIISVAMGVSTIVGIIIKYL